MKKVIFVGHRDLYFGAESVMFRVLQFLAKEHIALPFVVLPESKYSTFRERLSTVSDTEVKLARYKLIGGGLLRAILCMVYNLPAALKLRIFFAGKNMDMVYTNTSVNIVGPLLAWLLNIPHIWHFHEQPTGGNFRWIPPGLFPVYRFFLCRKNTTVVFISHMQQVLWEKEFGIAIPAAQVIYIPPSPLPEPLPAIEGKLVRFGFLGSWTASKNIPALLQGFAALRQQYPEQPVSLTLMGEGELKAQLLEQIDALQLNDSVVLMPHAADILPFFSSIDVFVLPSFFESWGLVALEALSQKKAVICTMNTGLTEILEHGTDCLFFDPVRQEALQECMEKFLLEPSCRAAIGARGYARLKELELSEKFQTGLRSLFDRK